MEVLVIGCGIVGKRHAEAQAKAGNTVGVYDHTIVKAKRLSDECGYAFFDRLEDAISWADLVHICTPDHVHVQSALLAIRTGKAVLCEKPLTTSLADAKKIQQAVHRHRTTFIVANNYRLTSTFQHIKNELENSGEPLISLETTYLHNMRSYIQSTPWRANQDFLYGGAIHAIDLAVWIANEPIESVYARTGVKVIDGYNQPEDYKILLNFASGLTATIWANANLSLPVHKTDLLVFTTNTSYEADNKNGVVYSYNKFQTKKDWVTKQFPVNKTIDDEIAIVNAYLSGEHTDHAPLPGIDEAVQVIEVVDLIQQSLHHRRQIEKKLHKHFKLF